MALEDICSFKDKPLHQSFPFSALEESSTSIYINDYGSPKQRRWETSEKSSPLHLFMPHLPQAGPFLNRPTSSLNPLNHSASVRRPFPLTHGTTTLGFIYQGGVIAAADTRASAGGLVACPAVHKITPIHSHLVVTSSGSGADCMLWERILIREIRLYQLRHSRRLSIRATAKLLSLMLHPFKGTEVCVALTLCGWDKEEGPTGREKKLEDPSCMTDNDSMGVFTSRDGTSAANTSSLNIGPRVIYVCSDGAHLQGNVFSVGSGSPYAYGVLDGGLQKNLSKGEAITLAREAVFRATHRDAYSGNNVDLFHVTAQGWTQRPREDLREEYYRDMESKGRIVK